MSLMKDMLNAGVHYGHKTKFWNPKMKFFIFGVNHKIHILDLEKTVVFFKKTLLFITKIASKKGKILFVGTKRQARKIISEEALRCNMPYVNYRWLGGMLTNYKTMRQSIKRLRSLQKMKDDGLFNKLTKKESLGIDRNICKLEKYLGGIKNMGGLPDVVLIIDSKKEDIAVTEAIRLGIPVIAVVDTNSDPDKIDYVIPGNDDSAKSIRFYLRHISDTIIENNFNKKHTV